MLIAVGHGVFQTLQLKIIMYYSIHCSLTHSNFSLNLASCSVSLWCALLAKHQIVYGLLHQCSLVCAPNVVVRCRDDDPRWPFFESFAAVHPAHFCSNPSAGTLLSTDDYCNPSTKLNS